jgi:hypothetical protein
MRRILKCGGECAIVALRTRHATIAVSVALPGKEVKQGVGVVSKVTKTLDRILRGNADANIRFDDLRAVLKHLGFTERIRGDHYILTRESVVEILNLQPRDGKAKTYQVKQVRVLISNYGLAGEEEGGDAR